MPGGKDIQVLFNAVTAAAEGGLYAYALERSRELLREYPEFGFGWLWHGIILCDLARYVEAEDAFYNAESLLPEKSLRHVYVQLGHLEKRRGTLDRAAYWYRRAIDNAPDLADGWIFLGAVLALKGELNKAEEAHRHAAKCEKVVLTKLT